MRYDRERILEPTSHKREGPPPNPRVARACGWHTRQPEGMGTWAITDSYDETVISGILELLAQEWWTKHRDPRDVEASLRGSQLVFTATSDNDEVVGTARVLTDFAYLAIVLDVISCQAHRGEGVGAALMDAITSHPRLQDVDSIELICQPGLQGFYSRWGFTGDVGRSTLMRRTSNPALGGRAIP